MNAPETESPAMKITLSRIDLIRGLAAVHRVVERRNTIPILSNALLSAEAGALRIRATDLDIEVTVQVAAVVDQPGAATLPAHMLYDIARKLPEGAEVQIDCSTPDSRAVIRSGRSRFAVGTLPAHDFPDIATGDLPHSFEMPAADLAALIADTEFAISTEETRYYLNGIYLHAIEAEAGPRLRAVATDGHRLARRDVAQPAGAAGMPGIIVPRKAVAEIARMLDKATEPVALSLSPAKLVLELGGTRFVTKLIDGTFPDYARVIPKGNGNVATIYAGATLAAIDRVASVGTERGRAAKFSFGDGTLAITVVNPDAGDAREEVDADYDAAPLEIGFNAKYIADIITVLIRAGADTIRIEMNTPGDPTILRSAAGGDLLTVLMPMRV